MSKRLQAKHKIDRRLGVNLWGRPRSPFNKREYGPGEHGQRRRKPSDFGLQLAAKQKLKGYYGSIGEKKFRSYYQKADQIKGDTSENLIQLLERRLDAVVYRAKFVPTVFAARQFVNHGHVMVNGRRVNIPSFQVQDGDVIRGARRAGLHQRRPQEDEGDVCTRTQARGRALPGAHGTEPGDRVLFTVGAPTFRSHKGVPPETGRFFRARCIHPPHQP
jgi:small subunit ribosomal protein S4